MTTQWSMASGIRGLARLGPRRALAAARTALLASIVEIALRMGQLPKIATRLGVPLDQSPAPARPDQLPTAPAFTPAERRALNTVRRVLSHRPFNGTCLRQALLVGNVLRARQPVLRVGVRKTAGRVEAHAWVEVAGCAIDQYRVIPAWRDDFLLLQPLAGGSVRAAWQDLR